ncbi:hypothetical protein DF19_08550 [Streptomyces olindensis]|nr:hypothetical protein DF19_18495 [Streptomyces olindensis]KDN77638.1 hypothetical protein DF19_08550 [Streptomyces olindensis]
MLAHSLDWQDVWQALDHGAASHLLESPHAELWLPWVLLRTAHGGSCLDPEIVATRDRLRRWPGVTWGGVVTLMLMHVAVAAVAVPVYRLFLPLR